MLNHVERAPHANLLAFHGAIEINVITPREAMFIVQTDGTLVQTLTDVTPCFAWSPDGRRLAYCPMDTVRRGPNGEIWVLDVSTGRKQKIAETGYMVYWSRRSDKMLIWNDVVYTWDEKTRQRSTTQLPIGLETISPTEEFCVVGDIDCNICRLHDLMTAETVATIRGLINEQPVWLNGHFLRTYRSHRDEVFDRRWYVMDCQSLLLFESRDRIIAADDEDSLLAVKDAKIVRRKLDELTPVSLDELKIELAPGVHIGTSPSTDAGVKK